MDNGAEEWVTSLYFFPSSSFLIKNWKKTQNVVCVAVRFNTHLPLLS